MTTAGALLERVRSAAPDHAAVAVAIRKLVSLRAGGASESNVRPALAALGRLIARIAAAADLVACASMRLERKGPAPVSFAALGGAGAIPKILARDALLDLVMREPKLAASAEEVRRLYNEEHAFALAKSMDAKITARVQDEMRKAFQSGRPWLNVAEIVRELGGWTRAYAETVIRTNATTAYSAGRFREATRMQSEGILAALRYAAVLDGDARPNHAAAHGLIAAVDDPVWEKMSPPCGYRCRCTLEPVDSVDIPDSLRGPDGRLRRAKLPPGAYADPGFGQRPDRIGLG
jgi:SPP1 gp7 family putative phage head morphogenesis protein